MTYALKKAQKAETVRFNYEQGNAPESALVVPTRSGKGKTL